MRKQNGFTFSLIALFLTTLVLVTFPLRTKSQNTRSVIQTIQIDGPTNTLHAVTANGDIFMPSASAPPSFNNENLVFSTSGAGTYITAVQKITLQGTAYTNATTTFSPIVGGSGPTMVFNMDASGPPYAGTCHFQWSASAATAGPKFELVGSQTASVVMLEMRSDVTVSTFLSAGAAALASAVANTGTVTTATLLDADLYFNVINGTTAGTLTVEAAANGSGTITLEPGSFCQMQ